MKPPILLMDGVNDPDEGTWVEFYDSIDDVRLKLEPWFADEPHVILDATGARIEVVRREYGPTEQIELELLRQEARPDIVRKFIIQELARMVSDHGSAPANLIPSDPRSVPLQELWRVYQDCVAWCKAAPSPRRSLLDKLKWFLPRAWQ